MEIEIETSIWVERPESFGHSEKVKVKVELTEIELAAAIMADSIGYAGPTHALLHVRDFKQGETKAYCERGSAIFGCDLDKLIKSAVHYWYRTEPEKRERLRKFAEEWKKVEERDPMAGSSISMLYPTMGV